MAQTFSDTSVNYSVETAELDDDLDTPDEQELAVPQRGGFKPPVEHYHAVAATAAKPKVASLDALFQELMEEPAETSDNFLDDLLSESVQSLEGKAKLKINRKKLLDTRVTGAERAAIEAENRYWELAREWKAVANVVIFNTQYCNCCGSQHSVLSGYFERQDHRTSNISRWQAVSKMNSSLRKESKHTETEVDVCIDCASACAWEPEAGCTYTPSKAKATMAAIPQGELLSEEGVEEATDGSAEALAAIELEIQAELDAELDESGKLAHITPL